MKRALILCAALLAAPAYASTLTRELAFDGLLAIDCAQTHQIGSAKSGFREQNPLLGRRPSSRRINQYFTLNALGHAAVTYLLPKQYRAAWQYVTIGLEGTVVAHNFYIGVRAPF